MLLLCGLAVLASCGGGGGGSDGGGGGGPAIGTVISHPTVSYVTSWAQSVPIVNSDLSGTIGAFPGQANIWDLGMDLSLLSGGDDQFFYALQMVEVDSAAGTGAFPQDQAYSDLQFMTPLMGFSSGVMVAAVSKGADLRAGHTALTGTYSAYLNSTSNSRLQHSLALSAATGNVSASWHDQVNTCDGSGNLLSIAGPAPSYRVVVRSTSGTELAELYSVTTATSIPLASHAADLTAYKNQTIVLSFEQKGPHENGKACYTIIDDVSVKDNGGAGTERVTNGTFESGDLTGWTTNTPAESQNVMTAARDVAGLSVTRSFYTSPDKLWGRWVDLFENKTTSAVTATVHYETDLGSSGCGVIYSTPTSTGLASGKALTSWDGSGDTRDIGWVFGSKAEAPAFTSDDLNSCTVGSELIDVAFTITVPAKGKVSLVNFILMSGTNTGMLSPIVTTKATAIDTEADNILTKFWTDKQYRNGMTRDQINTVHNF